MWWVEGKVFKNYDRVHGHRGKYGREKIALKNKKEGVFNKYVFELFCTQLMQVKSDAFFLLLALCCDCTQEGSIFSFSSCGIFYTFSRVSYL